MPGTLLLDDWRDDVQKRLNQTITDLQRQTQSALETAAQPVQQAQQTAAAVLPQVDPGPISQRLNGLIDQLTQPAQQVVQPLQAGGEQAYGAVQQVGQRMNSLVDQLTTQNTSTQGVVPLGAPQAQQGDVLGSAPSADTTQTASATVTPTRVGQGQSAFISSLQPLAQRVAARTGIDPNVMIAIAANETGWGQSDTAKQQNNLFSIQGPSGRASRWASYDSPEQSFEAFVDLISTAPRYKQAWAVRNNPEQFVDALRTAGYVADEPGYPAQGWVDQVKAINRNLPGGAPTGQQAAAATQPVALPHTEEPGSASDHLDDKWKTQFGFKATYTGDYRTGTPHRGIDLVPQKGGIGTSIESFDNGEVTLIQRDSGGAGGLMVYIRDRDGLTHAYMHLQGTAPGLKVGQQVARGDYIANMGESGTEGSPHLHYEVRRGLNGDPLDQLIDPRPYMAGLGQGQGGASQPRQVGAAPAALPPSSEPGVLNIAQARAPQPIVSNSVFGPAGTERANEVVPRTLNQVGEAVGGAFDQLGQTVRRVGDEIGPNLTGDTAELDRRRAAAQAQPPQDLGGQPRPEFRPLPADQIGIGDIAGMAGRALLTGTGAQGQVQSPQQIQTAQKAATRPITGAVEEALGQVRLPGQTEPVPVLQGLSTMLIEQAFAAPYMIPGAIGSSAIMGIGKAIIGEVAADAPALVQVAARAGQGAINGGIQNAILAAGEPGADAQSVGTAFLVGAGFGTAMEGGPTAAVKIGQALVRRMPEIQDVLETALRSRQRGETTVDAALGGIPGAVERGAERLRGPEPPAPVPTPTEPRTSIREGGLGTPRYAYEPGSTPAQISDGLRQAAERDSSGVAHLDGPTLGAMPSLPRPSGEGVTVPKWQEGISPHLDDLRYAQDVGMNQSQWYSKFAQAVTSVVGEHNVNEFRTLFGITSQQTPPTENLQMTLGFMRMAREFTENGTNFTPQNIRQWIAANPRITSMGTQGAKWKITGDQLKKVAQLYTTGEVKVATNAKTSSYASNILSALLNRFDPNSTMDTWMAQIFNYKFPQRTASSDQAFQAMRTVVDHLAGETGQVPHAAQAAMWFAIKGAKDFAASKAGSRRLKALVKDFGTGRARLRDVLDQAKAEGAYDNMTGTWEEVAADRGVADELGKLRPMLEQNWARPDIADSSFLYYPGKGKAIKGAATVGGKAPRTSGVVPATTLERAGQAERQAGVAQVEVPPAAAEALGYNPETRQFSELRGVPHEVQGDQILVPGGNIDTLRYVAAKVHEAAGPDAPPATLYVYRPESTEHVGWQVLDIPPGSKGALVEDLHAAGIGFQELNDGTLGVNALPVRDANYENAVADAVSRAGASIEGLNGHVQTISPGQSSVALGQYGPRYGGAGQRGVPEPGGGVAGARLDAANVPATDLPTGFRAPGAVGRFFNPTARERGQSTPEFGLSLGSAAVGGAAGNAATPEDAPLDVRLRNIGVGALTGLAGGYAAGRGLGGRLAPEVARAEAGGFRAPGATRTDLEGMVRATTQEPPGSAREPTSLGGVKSNPHLLTEARAGERPLTDEELMSHADSLEARQAENTERLATIDELLRNPTAKPERPPWAGGLTNEQVVSLARSQGASAWEPLWWERAGLEAGSGEVRDLLREGGVVQRGMGQREPTPAELRAERASLQQDQEHLVAAADQLYQTPGQRFTRAERAPDDLPFNEPSAEGPLGAGGGRDEGAILAQEVVTKKGRLTSDENQVVGEAEGIIGRGIVNPTEVVREPPSAETARLMPNLRVLGGEMAEVAAQIQKSAEDNPALWEHYRQGTISFDSLKNDLALRVGMSKADWLKTKVGQAFNDREMVALQAALVESQNQQTALARDILAKGGVEKLTPEELAYALAQLTDAQRLAAVAKGAGSTTARALNSRKISFDQQLASTITAANERKAAARVRDQAKRATARAGELLETTKTLDREKAAATKGAPAGTPRNIVDQIAAAYDELDRYNAMSLHEKAAVFDRLKAEREARAAARKAVVRGAPEELLSALRAELKAEQDIFAGRKNTWETMAFWDSKVVENAAQERRAFRGGLYIEQQRKSAQLALVKAEKDAARSFDAEVRRRGQQSDKAKRMLESMGGEAPTKELLSNFVQAINDPDPMVAAKFLQGTHRMSNWARAGVVRIAGLVSSPITHMVNLGGNTTKALVMVPERALIVGLDAIRAGITGGERQAYRAELLPMLNAYGPGFLGALDNAARIMKTGITDEQTRDLSKVRAAFSGSEKLNFAVEAPLRALQAEDVLYRSGAMNSHSARVAMRQAVREGYAGEAANGRMATIMQNLEDYPELATEAIAAARREVFQERRSNVPGMPQNEATRFVISQPVPFYTTPVNITAQGGALSPFGLIGATQSALKARAMPRGTAAERAAQGRETLLAEERVARTMIGGALLGAGIALGNAGMLTGAYPSDAKEASTLPQGWRPWSLRLHDPITDNTYYLPVQNFAGFGFPLAMAAILTDPIHRGKSILDADEQLGAVAALGRYTLDTPFLQGLSDTVEALSNPKTAMQKFGESLVSSYVPYSSAGRELQRLAGIPTRNPHEGLVGLIDAMQAVVPGLSGNVPESTTPLGEARTQGASGAGRFVPYRYDIERDNPTLRALRDAGVGVPAAPKEIGVGRGYGIELTETEQDQVKRARGAAIVQAVAQERAKPRMQELERTLQTAPRDSAAYQRALQGYNAALAATVSGAATAANNDFVRGLGRDQMAQRMTLMKDIEPTYLGLPPQPEQAVGEPLR